MRAGGRSAGSVAAAERCCISRGRWRATRSCRSTPLGCPSPRIWANCRTSWLNFFAITSWPAFPIPFIPAFGSTAGAWLISASPYATTSPASAWCSTPTRISRPFRDVRCDGETVPMTSLQREAAGRVRLTAVRQHLVELVAARFHSIASPSSPTRRHFPGRLHMLPLNVLESPFAPSERRGGRLPSWLKRPLPAGNGNAFTQSLLEDLPLETVCENAKCPNRPECWSRRTATFMILGNVCTRPCSFCSVPKGALSVEDDEPARVAEAAVRLGLKHVVITSVPRRLARRRRRSFRARASPFARECPATRGSAHARFSGRCRGYRSRDGCPPRCLQPQRRDRAATLSRARGRAEYGRSLELLDRVKHRAPDRHQGGVDARHRRDDR